jgi:hypothetical protein
MVAVAGSGRLVSQGLDRQPVHLVDELGCSRDEPEPPPTPHTAGAVIPRLRPFQDERRFRTRLDSPQASENSK